MNLNRQDTPPAPKEVLWVERLKGGARGEFTIYTPKIWGVWTHYTRGRSKPCFEDHTLCPGGHAENNLRWYGYLHCWHYEKNRQVFLQLTEAGARLLLNQCATGASLRGMTVEVCRTSADNGRQKVLVKKWAQHGYRDQLPPPMDPNKSLFNMWDLAYEEVRFRKEEIETVEQIPDASKVA